MIVAAALFAAAAAVPLHPAVRNDLVEAITAERLGAHLDSLAVMGDVYGDRAVGPGYNASVAYALSLLAATPLSVSLQELTVPIWEEVEPATLVLAGDRVVTFKGGQDFAHQRYGGNGPLSVKADVVYVSSPCSAAGFSGFPAGAVALFATGGSCEDFEKAFNAEDAGAVAMLLHAAAGSSGFPTGRVRDTEWRFGDRLVEAPVIAVTYTVSQVITASADPVVDLSAHAKTTLIETSNVLAETPGGNRAKTIVVGGHMDSVPGTYGINDNGSGAMSVLELALQFSLLRPNSANKVVFALWGAEEIGLLGSREYVKRRDEYPYTIAGNFNNDMLSSPNGFRLVHNHRDAPAAAQEGSRKIEEALVEYYEANGLAWQLTSMTGGSDFLPFLLADIPAGGLATGAGQVKSVEERDIYGGLAGAIADPCYHEPCDDRGNPDAQLHLETTRALAYAVDKIANDSDF